MLLSAQRRRWCQLVEITKTFEAFRKDYDWKVLATGPNHSIQLKNGRLIVPVWLSTGTGGNAHRPSITATIYSDDGGESWQASEVAVSCTDEFVNPNSLRQRRDVGVRVSADEGKTWTLAKTIEYGWSCYSDINVTPKGTILCFYGRAEKQNFAGDRLTLARFNIDWLNLDWKLGSDRKLGND